MSYNINTTWTRLKAFVDDKKLHLQYVYNSDGYDIFTTDGEITYTTVIYNNAVPDPSLYSQVQNDADKADFLANYYSTANRATFPTVVRDGDAVPTAFNVLIGAGVDNNGNAQAFNASPDGYLTIQGSPTGTPIPVTVTGTITATNASTGTNNTTAPGSSTQIGGTDGTNLQAAHVYDTDNGAGTEWTLGASLRKSAPGGSVEFGTPTDPIYVISRGNNADGTPPTANPVLTAGWDGTNVQTIATDGYGATIITGKNANGTPPTANPILIAGWDGTNVVQLRLNSDGSVATADRELATFVSTGTSIASAQNKSMISILNADATLVTKIHEIYVVNVQTSSVTGVTGTFELRRITGHSAGTLLTPVSMDTSDTLDSDITVRTGSTVAGESSNLMWRALFSTDEWGPGSSDVESNDHIFQTMFPIFSRKTDSGTKPLVLRANEGLTVKFATNSTTGSFDIMVVFSQQ